MRVVITGADGFLGWHSRLRLEALTQHEVVPVNRRNWSHLASLVSGADAIIHLAGVNRGPDGAQVERSNIALARDVAQALRSADHLQTTVYANTVHSGSDNPYGRGKQAAGEVLAEACQATGVMFRDIRLPNLFGEHGRPHYNSFVATFVESVIAGSPADIRDAQVPLLHVQRAAQTLIDALQQVQTEVARLATPKSVREVWNQLGVFHATYGAAGVMPDLSNDFDLDLFNTYRAALFPRRCPGPLHPHRDSRGAFTETVRSHGGPGQTSVSTSAPEVTRGDHYHLRKVERFVVIRGQATIRLRRMFSDEVHRFEVSGAEPAAIDMPTGWAHNITNTGDDELITQFWTNDLFDPDHPDTYPHPVTAKEGR